MTSSDPAAEWPAAVRELSRRLARAFAAVDEWLAVDSRLFGFRPAPDAWSIGEVCEHLHLAHRFLLILARKIRAKCAKRLQAGAPWPAAPPRFEHLEKIAASSFPWTHPEHMTPAGVAARDALRAGLTADRDECLALLDAMPDGQGTLHRIRMSVVDDRLDLYQYLMVIALHLERHLAQMGRNRGAYERP